MFSSVLIKGSLGFRHVFAEITFEFHFFNVFLGMGDNSALVFVFKSTETTVPKAFLLGQIVYVSTYLFHFECFLTEML